MCRQMVPLTVSVSVIWRIRGLACRCNQAKSVKATLCTGQEIASIKELSP